MKRIVSKPWGSEDIWSLTEKYVGKILYINKGHKLSLQHHDCKDESIYVLSGTLELTFGHSLDELQIVRLGPSEVFRISPKLIHRFAAPDNDVTLFEVSTSELDDIIRHQDDYGRSNE